ncbi:nucleotide-binding protein [Anaerocolumna chitinilytica]|uniref:CD-NTase-associated protein 12/Pycsar effector protein TIR domain-containing protein n=1 Tax=Anaerocolumna chitinilytica TaxID=1727145 RepID=A0A7I8DK37_9FIRM|nr:nucleotide-binding protein [Anaerocolumna chitinilytica]BCJ97365.1 hypothetical protein bsdcttw_04060 [Anaerocolumna chitinilytica]
MKLFIGSSKEATEVMDDIALYLEDLCCEVIKWDAPTTFKPGEYTLEALCRINEQVDAAIFILTADDRVWYRGQDTIQPRDNVLFEFGLFCGKHGIKKTIIIKKGEIKIASDFNGITLIDYSKRLRAQREIKDWYESLMNNVMMWIEGTWDLFYYHNTDDTNPDGVAVIYNEKQNFKMKVNLKQSKNGKELSYLFEYNGFYYNNEIIAVYKTLPEQWPAMCGTVVISMSGNRKILVGGSLYVNHFSKLVNDKFIMKRRND